MKRCKRTMFDEDEIEVLTILLDLENLVRESEQRARGFAYHWGHKRRRSGRDFGRLVFPRPTTPADVNSLLGDPEIPIGPNLSPTTPLSFSPSESDEKPSTTPRKHSKKRVIEQQLENVRAYYNNQKANNLKLKAMKQELLSTAHERQERSMSVIWPDANVSQQPIVVDPMGQRFQFVQKGPRQSLLSSQNGLGMVNYRFGPIRIPDLNVSAEEMVVGSAQPIDLQRMGVDRKARCAEARRSRMIKNKLKIKGASRIITVPCRR